MFILSLKSNFGVCINCHSVCLSCLGSTQPGQIASSEKSVNSSDGMFTKDSWSGEESKIISFVVLRQDENQHKCKKTFYTGSGDGSSGCSVC